MDNNGALYELLYIDYLLLPYPLL